MIIHAPIAFFGALIIVFAAAYWAVRFRYHGTVASLQGRLDLKTAEADDYKRKLGGATPDEARERLDALEARVTEMGNRRLTGAHRQRLISALSITPAHVAIWHDMNAAGAADLAGDLRAVFQAAGWSVGGGMAGLSGAPPSGLSVAVATPRQLTPPQRAIVSSFREVGIRFDLIPPARQRPDDPASAVITVSAPPN
ncbi:MAG: hypothetical protein ACRED9_10310 [Caulobacteraceae bacterium]